MPSQQGTQLTPLAISIFGLEQAGFLPPTNRPRTSQEGNSRPRQDRRINSYFNQFQSRCAPSNDSPPTYAAAARQSRIPSSPRHLDNGKEILPRYTCTVQKEGPMYMLLESCSPFMILPGQEWREVYAVMNGTQLCIHKLKTSSFKDKRVYAAGRLIRKYTLQQAEVGIAPDVSHSILVPVTRMAGLIPTIARRRAFEKDPDLFRVEKQHSLRMRAELDQFTLCCPSEEQIFSWINHICAGIDIAAPLDERSVPRQCTMPRRRRRQRPVSASNLQDQRLIEEQQRILQSLYPAFAEDTPTPPNEVPETIERGVPSHVSSNDVSPGEQEQEDVDLSVIAEDVPNSASNSASATPPRPQASRFTTTDTVMTVASLPSLPSTNRINIDLYGKWSPPHPRTATQHIRYIRRCMPLLLEDTPRHSGVMIHQGKYIRPNFKADSLDAWSLKPPSYDAHDFPEDVTNALTRRTTRSSSNGGSSVSDNMAAGMDIQRVDTPAQEMASPNAPQLLLEKSRSNSPKRPGGLFSKSTLRASSAEEHSGPKTRSESSEVEAGLVLVGF